MDPTGDRLHQNLEFSRCDSDLRKRASKRFVDITNFCVNLYTSSSATDFWIRTLDVDSPRFFFYSKQRGGSFQKIVVSARTVSRP